GRFRLPRLSLGAGSGRFGLPRPIAFRRAALWLVRPRSITARGVARLVLPGPIASGRARRRFTPGTIAAGPAGAWRRGAWRSGSQLVALGAHLASLAPLRFLVELRARDFVIAARPPVLGAPLAGHGGFLPRLALRLLRIPQPALR